MFDDPIQAIETLANRLTTVESEHALVRAGRVLHAPIVADRDSPAIDVSAMDGYALRVGDLGPKPLPVVAELQPGMPPVELPAGSAIRLFTGAAVPQWADLVVMREDTNEANPSQVQLLEKAMSLTRGANIRYRGENGKQGDTILPSGHLLTTASIAASATFGTRTARLYRCVRVSIIVTGNELLDIEDQPAPWELRDSNGPTVAAIGEAHPWIECLPPQRCGDHADQLQDVLNKSLHQSDAVILTGGVSKGNYDHVPSVIAQSGAATIFHRLPIRPGRPILGAVSPKGQLILGLPGNPVSAAVNMLRWGIPLLAKQSGQTDWRPKPHSIVVQGATDKKLPLHWFRLVELTGPGTATLLDGKGSGDLVALARSTGFIHQPPNESGSGPWPYFGW